MEVILGFICLALLIYVAWQERGFQREREAFARERSELMTRIQAPEVASFVLGDETVEQQYVDFDDDDDFQKAQEVLKEVEYRETEV